MRRRRRRDLVGAVDAGGGRHRAAGETHCDGQAGTQAVQRGDVANQFQRSQSGGQAFQRGRGDDRDHRRALRGRAGAKRVGLLAQGFGHAMGEDGADFLGGRAAVQGEADGFGIGQSVVQCAQPDGAGGARFVGVRAGLAKGFAKGIDPGQRAIRADFAPGAPDYGHDTRVHDAKAGPTEKGRAGHLIDDEAGQGQRGTANGQNAQTDNDPGEGADAGRGRDHGNDGWRRIGRAAGGFDEAGIQHGLHRPGFDRRRGKRRPRIADEARLERVHSLSPIRSARIWSRPRCGMPFAPCGSIGGGVKAGSSKYRPDQKFSGGRAMGTLPTR